MARRAASIPTVQGDIVERLAGRHGPAPTGRQLGPAGRPVRRAQRHQVAGAVRRAARARARSRGLIMLFIMFTLLMLQLQSFSRRGAGLPDRPMGIAGVAAALLLLNRPFGFRRVLLGVIALMGMIQRNW